MIITEFHRTRKDGVNLVKTYSDNNVYIKNIDTGVEYANVINPENSGRVYIETDKQIERNEEDINFEDLKENTNI